MLLRITGSRAKVRKVRSHRFSIYLLTHYYICGNLYDVYYLLSKRNQRVIQHKVDTSSSCFYVQAGYNSLFVIMRQNTTADIFVLLHCLNVLDAETLLFIICSAANEVYRIFQFWFLDRLIAHRSNNKHSLTY